MNDHTIVVIWAIKIFFWYSSSVYSCHLFLISSASVRSLPFLSFIVSMFAWNVLLVSNFLKEICSLSHSIVFLYFFALLTEGGFLISPCYSLELCIRMGISFLFFITFCSSSFSGICKALSDNHFAFCISGMVLITASCRILWTCIHSSSGTLSIWSNALNLFSLSLYSHKGFDLGHT